MLPKTKILCGRNLANPVNVESRNQRKNHEHHEHRYTESISRSERRGNRMRVSSSPWTAAAAGTVVINGSAGPNVLERKTKLAELRQHIADVIKKRDQI